VLSSRVINAFIMTPTMKSSFPKPFKEAEILNHICNKFELVYELGYKYSIRRENKTVATE
jgi:hypothetical protein